MAFFSAASYIYLVLTSFKVSGVKKTGEETDKKKADCSNTKLRTKIVYN